MVWLAIFLGGGLGSLLRYGAGVLGKHLFGVGFPVGTLAANVAGSFLLGLFARVLVEDRFSAPVRAGLTTGLCGGFTTYSTFNHEALTMMEGGHLGRAGLYLVATLVLSGLAGAAGLYLGGRLSA